MNKFFIFLGVVLSGYFLLQFNQGDLDTNQVFDMIVNDSPTVVKQTDQVRESTSTPVKNDEIILWKYDQVANGAFADYLGSLRGEDFQNVVILGENHSLLGNTNVLVEDFTFKNKGPSDYAKELVKKDFVSLSQWAYKYEISIESVKGDAVKLFPNARIIGVLVKPFSEQQELNELANVLSETTTGPTLFIFTTASKEAINTDLEIFQNELLKTVIESGDLDSIPQALGDEAAVLKVALQVVDEKNQHLVIDEIWNSGVRAKSQPGAAKEDRKLTIMAFGDLMPGRFVRTLMDRNGKDYIFEKLSNSEINMFERADLIFANLEGPIKGAGKSGGTAMNFAFNEDIAPFLKEYGFNLFSIANNHATDQGWDGRITTIEALEDADIGWCGHPSEVDRDSVYYTTIDDKKVAFVCFHDVTFKLDDKAAVEMISEIRPSVDYLVVSIHWGIEYNHTPDNTLQISPGHAFIDAGADMVIGHHPHVVQSFEIYNGRPIFYSLGNFVFDQYWSRATQEELALGVVLDDADDSGEHFNAKIYLFPMKSENSQSRLMNEDEKFRWTEDFIGYGNYDEDMKNQIRDGVIEIWD